MYEWKLNKNRQGEDGWHPILLGLALRSTPMNYDSEIGFLLLWLALFYYANEFWLMAETWLAPSEMGSKSPRNCRHSFPLTSSKFKFGQPPQMCSRLLCTEGMLWPVICIPQSSLRMKPCSLSGGLVSWTVIRRKKLCVKLDGNMRAFLTASESTWGQSSTSA